MKKENLIALLFVAVSLILAVISFILMPETVVIQVHMDGTPSTSVPKLLGLSLPVLLAAGGAVYYRIQHEPKALFIAAVGIIVEVAMLFMNL